MKSPFIRELKPDEIATAIFLVSAKEIRQKRTGEPYLSLVLSDRTGELDCKMWDNVGDVLDAFEREDFVKVKGLLQLYNNRPQFTIHKLRRVEDHEVDFRDFFPASVHDPEVMWAELRSIVSAICNNHIRNLLNAFLDDPDIASRYRVAPAAKSIHHAFRSGLLEHVVSLLKLAKLVGSHYESVDTDLLYAGVVLHDIGKIYELSYDRGFGYSTEGQLLGHIAIAIRMLSNKLRDFPEFPPQLRNLIEHMVLSHHGQLEFGSPKVPLFPEALLLHYLDDMDSKMECMRALIERDPQSEGCFSAYSASLGRVALRKSRYLDASAGSTVPDGSGPASDSKNFIYAAGDAAAEITKPDGFTLNSDNNHCNSFHSPVNTFHQSSTASTSTPTQPGRSPAPGPSTSKPAPATNTIFGAKLQQALQSERK